MSARKKFPIETKNSKTPIDKQHLCYHHYMETVRCCAKEIAILERVFAQLTQQGRLPPRALDRQTRKSWSHFKEEFKNAPFNIHRHEFKEILYHAREKDQ